MMVYYLISLSALILALILLRTVFRKKVSQRLIYGMWLLVVLRMCLPFTLFHYEIPRASVIIPETEQVTEGGIATDASPAPDTYVPHVTDETSAPIVQTPLMTEEITYKDEPKETSAPTIKNEVHTEAPARINYKMIIYGVWATGFVLIALWYAGSYVYFSAKLMRGRVSHGKHKLLKVYVSKRAASPCISGIVPAVYVTESAQTSPDLPFVLEHEYAHFKHGDTFWSLIRVLACSVFWWNPLVWAAAILSKQDAEFACDEAVTAKFTENERLRYANTIINMIPVKKSFASGFVNGSVKDRLVMIKGGKKNSIFISVIAVLLALICVGCSYSGPKNSNDTEALINDDKNETVTSNKVTYSDILKQYKVIADSYENGTILIDGDKLDGERLGHLTKSDSDHIKNSWGCMLVDNIAPYQSKSTIDFGYAFYDINKDGTDELIWLREDYDYYYDSDYSYKIIAVFTLCDGEAYLLDAYFNKYTAVIVDGGIYSHSNGGAVYSSNTLSTISPNDNRLTESLTFGLDGYKDESTGEVNYYKTTDGEKTEISEVEYNELAKSFTDEISAMSKDYLDSLEIQYISINLETFAFLDEQSVEIIEKSDNWLEDNALKFGINNPKIVSTHKGCLFETGKENTVYIIAGSDSTDSTFKKTYLAAETDENIYIFNLSYYDETTELYITECEVCICDFNGDGIDEISINKNIDMAGGAGTYISQIFTFYNKSLYKILESESSKCFDTGFHGEFIGDYNFKVTNTITGYSITLDMSEYYLPEAFDENGYLKLDYKMGCDNFFEFSPKDVDSDGIYEVVCLQYAYVGTHASGIGHAKSILKFDVQTQEFEVIETDFITNEPIVEIGIPSLDELKSKYLIENSEKNCISIRIPQFTNEPYSSINNKILDYVTSKVNHLCASKFELNESQSDIGQNDYTDYYIDIDYKVTYFSDELVSIVFSGIMNRKSAAHPTNEFFTLNLDPRTGTQIYFSDKYVADDDLYYALDEYVENNYLDFSEHPIIFKELVLKDDFLNAIKTDSYYYCYYTESSIGFSIPVPHALGDHIDIELEYSDLKVKKK